jgi:isochorismate synthase
VILSPVSSNIQINMQKLFSHIWQVAVQNGWAVALWRLPNSTEQHLVVDFSQKFSSSFLQKDFNKDAHNVFNLEESPSGFAVSPFINQNLQQTYFIKADLHFISTQPEPKNSSKNINEALFLEKLEEYANNNETQKDSYIKPLPNAFFEETEKQKIHFQGIVEKAIEQMKQKKFLKVVLSREQEVFFTNKSENQYNELEINPFTIFEKLCETYSSAFVSLWHIPQVGTWAGATPETLVSVDTNGVFKTMALAGTQAYTPEKTTSNAVWTQKEIEEQALVSRYIINSFKTVRVREFEEEGPKTVIAGNLMHLQTDFWTNIQEIHYPQLPTVMLGLLHPTSAVCGMPKPQALQFILENENYSRSFYSGFLGPVNIQEETHLFVNLRCMQLFEKSCKIYAGCGITEDSNPEKEWNETVLKTQTMMRIFKTV